MENDFFTNLMLFIVVVFGAAFMIRHVFRNSQADTNKPRPYSFVRFRFENIDDEDKIHYAHFQLEKNQRLIFINEIPNMSGHCILTKTTRNKDDSESVKTYVGYHTSDFVELTAEEV
jgi:hypothetical protein